MKILVFGLFVMLSGYSFASDLVLAKQITLNSEILDQQRTVFVKLPEGYQETQSTYPVMYVLHGQWDMLPTLSVLDLLENDIPNFIVVGIESRGMELAPNDGNKTEFATFLSEEVVPFINKNYRTAEYSILSGHSNSGRFVVDYWANQNTLFSQYFSFSPSLDDGYLVEQVKGRDTLSNLKPLVLTIADEGEHMQTPFDTLSHQLSNVAGLPFTFRKFPEQSHRTTKHPSMQFALQQTFLDWQPSYETKIAGFDKLRGHYVALTKKFGFKVEIPNETLQRLTAHYAISDNTRAIEQLKKHVAFTIKQNSEGLAAMFEMSDYLSNNGYEQAGKKLHSEICLAAKSSQRCQLN